MAAFLNGSRSSLPCVLFALRRESMYFRRLCRPFQRLPSAPCDACLAGSPAHPVLIMETGVGRAAVGAALDWLFAGPQRPQFVLYAGFAGALAPDLHVGQVVV